MEESQKDISAQNTRNLYVFEQKNILQLDQQKPQQVLRMEDQSQLQDRFEDDKLQKLKNYRSEHSFYAIQSGKIKNSNSCLTYKINDPSCQVLLENAFFYMKDASSCFKQKSMKLFYEKKYTSKDLESYILKYTQQYTNDQDQYFQEYKCSASKRKQQFKVQYKTNDQDAYGCCLALSYYTGVYSQRISRNSNIIIKLDISQSASKIKQSGKFQCMKCISYWLFKALNYIPLYWGEVTRCIHLTPQESKLYDVGNIVTWIQFSSSSYGQPTEYFQERNTRFIIYSLSGRCIEKYSNYGNQTEVLFKPLSHFLVLKRQIIGTKLFIYLRQIFFGQSEKNILWVDDNIFDSKWQNKLLMERAIKSQPLLNIIPKVSTQSALAFIKSELCKNRKPQEFRIISDMTRKNEKSPHNAGARFIKQLIPIYNNLKVLVFTSNKNKGQQYLKQLGIKNPNIEVTVTAQKAIQFLNFR